MARNINVMAAAMAYGGNNGENQLKASITAWCATTRFLLNRVSVISEKLANNEKSGMKKMAKNGGINGGGVAKRSIRRKWRAAMK
jgi:hypothetical protein